MSTAVVESGQVPRSRAQLGPELNAALLDPGPAPEHGWRRVDAGPAHANYVALSPRGDVMIMLTKSGRIMLVDICRLDAPDGANEVTHRLIERRTGQPPRLGNAAGTFDKLEPVVVAAGQLGARSPWRWEGLTLAEPGPGVWLPGEISRAAVAVNTTGQAGQAWSIARRGCFVIYRRRSHCPITGPGGASTFRNWVDAMDYVGRHDAVVAQAEAERAATPSAAKPIWPRYVEALRHASRMADPAWLPPGWTELPPDGAARRLMHDTRDRAVLITQAPTPPSTFHVVVDGEIVSEHDQATGRKAPFAFSSLPAAVYYVEHDLFPREGLTYV